MKMIDDFIKLAAGFIHQVIINLLIQVPMTRQVANINLRLNSNQSTSCKKLQVSHWRKPAAKSAAWQSNSASTAQDLSFFVGLASHWSI